MQVVKILVFFALGATVSGSPNVPIWELLTHQEKMGRLMYIFTHLVDGYCKGSNIPDCNKVLTLYGMSNLLNEDDDALNIMDPYQHNSKIIIWEKIMRGDFRIPPNKSFYSNSIVKEVQADEEYDYINEIYDSPSSYQVNQRINKLSNDPHPFAVRVPAPSKIVAANATRMVAFNQGRTSLDTTKEYRIEDVDMAVGSSHPYAVKVLPAPTASENIPVGIKASGDYEPMMVESRVNEAHVLPPTLAILKRERRTVGESFNDEEMKFLLSRVFEN